jgi:hypothetical protein
VSVNPPERGQLLTVNHDRRERAIIAVAPGPLELGLGAELAIELAKELKAVYQYSALLGRLRALKRLFLSDPIVVGPSR